MDLRVLYILSVKHSLALSSQTVHRTAPWMSSTKYLSFKGIHESKHQRSSKVWQWKVKLLYMIIHCHMVLIMGQCTNKWSVVSNCPQKTQSVLPIQPFFRILVFVQILFLLTSHMKFFILRGNIPQNLYWVCPHTLTRDKREWTVNFSDED